VPPSHDEEGASCVRGSRAGLPTVDFGVPWPVALHVSWNPETLELAAPGGPCAVSMGADLTVLVAALRGGAGPMSPATAVESLCVALKHGDRDFAELACKHGAVEAAISLLGITHLSRAEDVDIERGATEALWYLCDDYYSCQLLIRNHGHCTLLKLARERGPVDARVAINIFRVLTSTLYCEARDSEVWHTTHADFFVEALGWALQADRTGVKDGAAVAGLVCDVAALWVQRAGSIVGSDALRALVGIIPLLLESMAANADDLYLQQHGCRLLWALARGCRSWPEHSRQPALAALMQMAAPLQFSLIPEVGAFSIMALNAVAGLPIPSSGGSGGLSCMD